KGMPNTLGSTRFASGTPSVSASTGTAAVIQRKRLRPRGRIGPVTPLVRAHDLDDLHRRHQRVALGGKARDASHDVHSRDDVTEGRITRPGRRTIQRRLIAITDKEFGRRRVRVGAARHGNRSVDVLQTSLRRRLELQLWVAAMLVDLITALYDETGNRPE